jgi:hypothetical protein
MLYPIVKTVVVRRTVANISSNEKFVELRDAALNAEFAFLQKMQETLQKNIGTFRKDMTQLECKYFQADSRCPIINAVKFDTFGVPGGEPIISRLHPNVVACMAHGPYYKKGMEVRIQVSTPLQVVYFLTAALHALTLQECKRFGPSSRARRVWRMIGLRAG